MAKNDNSNGNGLNLGEIGMIRNILMGEQISDFEIKFNQLQDQLDNLEKRLNLKIESVDSSRTETTSKIEKDVDKKFLELEKQITLNVDKIHNRIDKVSKEDKVRLGKMMEKLSKQLLDG